VNLLRVNPTSETLSEPENTHFGKNYDSNVSWGKTILETSVAKVINQGTREAKQNETPLEELSDGNRSHGIFLQKRTCGSKSTCTSKGARRHTV